MMVLIMCPTSKSGKGARYWPFWKECLDKKGGSYKCIETRYPGHACEIARKAEGTVVAVGGDGIINEVLNGVLTADRPQTMGVLYCGTSPDFCRFHGIPIRPAESIEVLLSGIDHSIDVVKVRYRSDDNRSVTKYFACSCNIGLGADVARFANAKRKIFGDALGTFLGLMRAILLHRPKDLEVVIDGQKYFFKKCNHLIVIKNPYIASGLKLDLDLNNDDGRGTIMAICHQTRLGLLRLLPGIYTGRIVKSENVFIKPFKTVEVASEEKVEIEFDGDPKGYLPLKAEIAAGQLKLIGAVNA